MLKNLPYLKLGFSDWAIFALVLFIFAVGGGNPPLQFVEILLLVTVPIRAYQWWNVESIFSAFDAKDTEELAGFQKTHNWISWIFAAVTLLFTVLLFGKVSDPDRFSPFSGILLLVSFLLGRGVYAHALHIHVVGTD